MSPTVKKSDYDKAAGMLVHISHPKVNHNLPFIFLGTKYVSYGP